MDILSGSYSRMGGDMAGLMAEGAAGGGGMGGPQVLRLTDEEMAAVDRLTEMGFDRAEAAQAFLACDKNEALAANPSILPAGPSAHQHQFPSPA